MTSQCGQHDVTDPRGRMAFPEGEARGKLSSKRRPCLIYEYGTRSLQSRC